MVIEALVRAVLEFVGVKGIAVGVAAPALVGLYYLREAAELFVLFARYARVLSLIGLVVLALYVAGTVSGFVDVSSIGQFINQLAEMVH